MKIKPEDYPLIARTEPPMFHPNVQRHMDNSEFSSEYKAAWERLQNTRHARLIRETIMQQFGKSNTTKMVSQLAKEAKIDPCWYLFRGLTIGVCRTAPDLVFVAIFYRQAALCAGGVFTDMPDGSSRAHMDLGTYEPDQFLEGTAVMMGLAIPTFLEFADIEKIEIGPNAKAGKRYKADDEKYLNMVDADIEIIDSRWFRQISRDKEFGVHGHFRLQPYGPGRTKRKLVYIADFVKQGYHRRATKDKNTSE